MAEIKIFKAENYAVLDSEPAVCEGRKKESLAAAAALTEMGAENLRYGENNKPEADNCFVSTSHSGGTVAVAMSLRPVGIDIEKTGTKRDFKKLAERFFKGAEKEFFSRRGTEKAFLCVWTRKEAYSKISGRGLAEIFAGFDSFSLDGYSFKTEIAGDYVCSLCEKDETP